MNAYEIKRWQDHVIDPATQQVIQQGTPQSATNFNNMEQGIFSNAEKTAVLFQQVSHHKRLLSDFEGEIATVTLTNTESYPFNNSKITRSLSKVRDTVNYTIMVEIVSFVGIPGIIKITDKAVNGFKIEYTGSATSVVLKYYIRGGMYQ